jgi:hypothetical protein
MTLPVFPTLPGLTFTMLKTPEFDTLDTRAPNAYETRIKQTINPTWNYTLIYDFLHDFAWGSYTTVTELRTLMGFFLQMGGKAGSFLFTDEDDCYVGPALLTGATPLFLLLFQGGVFQTPGGVDYTLSGSSITFVTAPAFGNSLYASGLTTTSAGQTPLGQVPSGTINGTNTVFTISGGTPVLAMVFLNGIYQTPGGFDYTLSGSTITFNTAPSVGSHIYVAGLANGSTATVTQQVPSGPVNGVNSIFHVSGGDLVLSVFLNGIFMSPSIDYLLVAGTIAFNVAPSVGDKLYAIVLDGTSSGLSQIPTGPINGTNTAFSIGMSINAPLAQLSLVNDGMGNYYSPIQRTLDGIFFEDVTDLNGTIDVYSGGVLASLGTAPGQYTVAGPGLAIPGASYMGLYLKWGAGAAAWVAGTAYALNATILDPAGHIQKATVAGTAGSTRPVFNDAGGTTPDGSGSLVWTDQGYYVGPTAPITAEFYFYFRVRFEADSQDFEKFLGVGAAAVRAGQGGGYWTIGGSESQNGAGTLKLTTARPVAA